MGSVVGQLHSLSLSPLALVQGKVLEAAKHAEEGGGERGAEQKALPQSPRRQRKTWSHTHSAHTDLTVRRGRVETALEG